MRTYGRIFPANGPPQWVKVETDANGHDDYVWITTLLQVLALNLGESPFYGDWGIPAEQSVIQQIFPDYYVTLIQQRFAPYFASLTIAKVNSPKPVYNINIVTNAGVKRAMSVPQ